jgi:hypothetical protein
MSFADAKRIEYPGGVLRHHVHGIGDVWLVTEAAAPIVNGNNAIVLCQAWGLTKETSRAIKSNAGEQDKGITPTMCLIVQADVADFDCGHFPSLPVLGVY